MTVKVVNLSVKTEGNEGACPNCGEHVSVRMSNYKGSFENKLQWQNDDGTAHLQWMGAGKFACKKGGVTPTPPPPPPMQDRPVNMEDTEVSGDEIKDVIRQTHRIQQVEAVIRGELSRNTAAPVSDAKVGMYIKLVLDLMSGR